MLVGCGRSPEPAGGKVSYLWTLSTPQGGETALGAQSRPSPGQPLTLHVAADSQATDVYLSSFQGQSLAEPPQRVSVPANTEQVVDWRVPPGQESSKIFTVFLPTDSPSSREMEGLLTQCSQQGVQGAAGQRLYDRLSEWAGEDRSGSASAGPEVVELGAALSTALTSPESVAQSNSGRGAALEDAAPQAAPMKPKGASPFDWRKSSRQVEVGSEVHPVVITDFASRPR